MAALQEQINLAALLALMAIEMGKIVGRLRVQKLMYLLQQKGAAPLDPFFFEYHHYGPFSAEVADVIKGAVRSEIIKEREDHDDDGWKRFEYEPAEDAERYAALVDQGTRALVGEVLEACKGAHWRTLELAATADFLKRANHLDDERAMREALERKPACVPFEASARQLLSALALS